MRVRAIERIFEKGTIRKPGDEFDVTEERARALGAVVEPVEFVEAPEAPAVHKQVRKRRKHGAQ